MKNFRLGIRRPFAPTESEALPVEGHPTASWLDSYATQFSLVELDFPMSRFPSPETIQEFVQELTRWETLGVSCALPPQLLIESVAPQNPKTSESSIETFLERVVEPLERAQRLEALLVEVPFSLEARGPAGNEDPLDRLRSTLQRLQPALRRVAVEFRHDSWYDFSNARLVPDVLEVLSALRVNVARVDDAQRGLTPSHISTDWSYVRLRGPHKPASWLEQNSPDEAEPYDSQELARVAASLQSDSSLGPSPLVVVCRPRVQEALQLATQLVKQLGPPLHLGADLLSTRDRSLDEYASGTRQKTEAKKSRKTTNEPS